jgi:hypothetical protein
MPDLDRNAEQAVREAAYFIWKHEGCPEGQAQHHWERAVIERSSAQDVDATMNSRRTRKKSWPGEPT